MSLDSSTQNIGIIVNASMKNIVKFNYTNMKGETSQKTTEIYEVRNDKFFGFDLEANKIKCFLFAQVENVVECGTFVPRDFSK